MLMSDVRLSPRKFPLQNCADISTQPRHLEPRHSLPLSHRKERSQHPSRCRLTRYSGPKYAIHGPHHPLPSRSLRRTPQHSPGCVSARCGKIQTSSALQSWKWRCVSAASSTTSDLAELVGRCPRAKCLRVSTRLGPTASPLVGDPLATRALIDNYRLPLWLSEIRSRMNATCHEELPGARFIQQKLGAQLIMQSNASTLSNQEQANLSPH